MIESAAVASFCSARRLASSLPEIRYANAILTDGRSIHAFRFTIAAGPANSDHSARVRRRSIHPLPGTYTVSLTLPAKAARKLGVRGSRPVVIASGQAKAKAVLQKVLVRLKTTTKGRGLMRKAKRLDLSAGVKFKEQGEDSTLSVASPLRLAR